MKRLQAGDIPADAVLVDVRDELEAASRPLAALAGARGVVQAPLAVLEEGVTPALPPGATAVVVCENGSQGELAAAYLQAGGAADVAALDGGYRALRRLAGEAKVQEE